MHHSSAGWGRVAPSQATSGGPGLPVPGVTGVLLLVPTTIALFPPHTMTTTGYSPFELALPVLAGLIGVELALQTVVVANGSIAFGGNAPVVTLQ